MLPLRVAAFKIDSHAQRLREAGAIGAVSFRQNAAVLFDGGRDLAQATRLVRQKALIVPRNPYERAHAVRGLASHQGEQALEELFGPGRFYVTGQPLGNLSHGPIDLRSEEHTSEL